MQWVTYKTTLEHVSRYRSQQIEVKISQIIYYYNQTLANLAKLIFILPSNLLFEEQIKRLKMLICVISISKVMCISEDREMGQTGLSYSCALIMCISEDLEMGQTGLSNSCALIIGYVYK